MKNVHWSAILFFLLGGIVVGFMVVYITPYWGAPLSGLTFFILGVAFSERKVLWGWVMSFFRTARLLRQQDEHIELFVKPNIVDVDLYPEPIKPSIDVPYITISLVWDNRSFREVDIHDIRGTVSIEGHSPPDDLPSLISDTKLKPWQIQDSPSIITVNLTGNGLRIIQGIRDKGFGKAHIRVNLRVQINGEIFSYDPISYRALYIG